MRNSRSIAINAILLSLTVVLTVINAAIPTPVVNIAFLMLLPTLVAAQVERLTTAVFSGFMLGIMSLICAFIFPNITSSIFYNPLVSVLPRVLIAVVSWAAFKYLNVLVDKIAARLEKKKAMTEADGSVTGARTSKRGAKRFPIVSALSAAIGVMTNTLLVLAAIWVFFNNKEVGGMMVNAEFFTAMLATNFAIELGVCAVNVPPLVYAVKAVLKQPLTVNGYAYLKKLSAERLIDTGTGKGAEGAAHTAENAPKIDTYPSEATDIADIDEPESDNTDGGASNEAAN